VKTGIKYVYGPVPSRRLGSSLGVNLTPFKTCSYSCVYCQLGITTCKIAERRSFFPREEVLKEIERALESVRANYVTFAGEGEPTLSLDLGWLIEKVRKFISLRDLNSKIAVITNSSLLWRKDVREELANTDSCLPSLDATSDSVFRRINRPHRSIKIEKVVEGILEFGDDYDGELMVEVMLVKGYNDSRKELEAIASVLSELKPDRVHVLTPTRPPALNVEPADAKTIMLSVEIFEENGVNSSAINFPECGEFDFSVFSNVKEAIKIMSRHPMREEQLEKLSKHFGLSIEELKSIPGIVEKKFCGRKYYLYVP
jgi:wyosine [tRNA(Phe)-imidazoG37] synthetase (radical SAM superfamily)